MADSVWSDTPPTAPGWYWVLNRYGDGEESLAELRGAYWWWNGIALSPQYIAMEMKLGPRIPSAEELAALYQPSNPARKETT